MEILTPRSDSNHHNCPPTRAEATEPSSSVGSMHLLLASLLAALAVAEFPNFLKIDNCNDPQSFDLYPVYNCTTFSTYYFVNPVLYSIGRPSDTEIRLKVQYFQYPNCTSDVEPTKVTVKTMSKTCPSRLSYKGTPIHFVPQLGPHHRFITFYGDSTCSGPVQKISHVHDGCADVDDYCAKFQCQPDGSSHVQFYGQYDGACVYAPVGAPFIVQPSQCVGDSHEGTLFFTTSCVYGKPTASPSAPPA